MAVGADASRLCSSGNDSADRWAQIDATRACNSFGSAGLSARAISVSAASAPRSGIGIPKCACAALSAVSAPSCAASTESTVSSTVSGAVDGGAGVLLQPLAAKMTANANTPAAEILQMSEQATGSVRKAGSEARLYVVATPIGNLADISQRAVDVLRSVPVVACEDTRRAGLLLAHLGLARESTRLIALHVGNEAEASASVLADLRAGNAAALIADAGTPLVSDPGFDLVRMAWDAGFPVTPVPGPSAVTAALSASPVPANRFLFEGFLPARKTARQTALRKLLAVDVAVVFFEAPHRLRDTLADLVKLGGGDRRLFIGRELTKLHETLSAGTVAEALATGVVTDRGEFVCIPEPGGHPPGERVGGGGARCPCRRTAARSSRAPGREDHRRFAPGALPTGAGLVAPFWRLSPRERSKAGPAAQPHRPRMEQARK